MEYCVHGKLSGSVAAPVSKSDLHRLIIAAALSFGQKTVIAPYTLNDDIRATASIMEAAGAKISFAEKEIHVEGIDLCRKNFTADCCESGSTLRFLVPVLAALEADCMFIGQGRLPQRPITPLMEEMKAHGVDFSAENLPFSIGGKLQSGSFSFPGNVSSQYITGLLFALPLLKSDSRIVLTSPLESQAYVDMTLSVLQRFGIEIKCINTHEFVVPGGQHYHSPAKVVAEGDWSNAAFWLVAGALGCPLTITGIQQDSLQGDKAICSILQEMGAMLTIDHNHVYVNGGKLHGITIDGSQIPDIIPILSVAAACAEGETLVKNIARLRIKESDRLHAIAENLSSLGISVEEGVDFLRITGGKLLGGKTDSYSDHRMAMSMAVAALRCQQPVCINDPNCVKKSYPQFFEEFVHLGGVVNGIQLG